MKSSAHTTSMRIEAYTLLGGEKYRAAAQATYESFATETNAEIKRLENKIKSLRATQAQLFVALREAKRKDKKRNPPHKALGAPSK